MKIKPVSPLLITVMLVSAVVSFAKISSTVVGDLLARILGTQPSALALEEPSCSYHVNGTVPPLPTP